MKGDVKSKTDILVVDDERIVSLDIQSSLKRLGYNIVGSAEHGDDAFRIAEEHHPDLVLMDVKLKGGSDGIDAAGKISAKLDIPIVFLTAYSDPETINRAKSMGPFGFLLKPFEERELHSAIEIALFKHQMERQLKVAMNKAEAANEAKNAFLATVSHELRTPMNGIIGMTELLLTTNIDSDQKTYLSLVRQSAHGLMGILNELLDFSKIEARTLRLRKSEFNLVDFIGSIVRDMRPIAEDKGLELLVDIDDSIPVVVVGDYGRLKQVIVHLIENAIKFTSKGHVELVVSMADMTSLPLGRYSVNDNLMLRFSVSDTGVGMPKNLQEKVFDSFTQGEDYKTRTHQGLGLGLSISKRLVELMDGTIWIDSMPNEGTSVNFIVGLDVLENEYCELNPAVEKADSLDGVSLLVVEDTQTNRRLTTAVLENSGAKVQGVKNGLEALNMLKKEDFDAVVMDVRMPVMDGLEATRRIRQGEPGIKKPDIPHPGSYRLCNARRQRGVHVNGDEFLSGKTGRSG